MSTSVAPPPAPATAAVISTTPQRPNGFALALNPEGFAEMERLCKMLSETEYIPQPFQKKPHNIMVVGIMGARLGLDVFASMAGIAPINGRPTIWGDAMLAVCQSQPEWVDFQEYWEGDFGADTFTARCIVERRGRRPYPAEFSIADAKKANLWGKQGPWQTMPKRMLQMRARAFALRGAFPDRLAGIYANEELEGVEDITASATVRETIPEPKPAVTREVPPEKADAEKVTVSIQTSPADPIGSIVNHQSEKPADPFDGGGIVLTVADLKVGAEGLARRFGAEGMKAVRQFNDRLGVKKVSDCPPERVAQAFEILKAFQRELEETGKVAP